MGMSDSHFNMTAILPFVAPLGWVVGSSRRSPGAAGQDLTCQQVGQVGGQLGAAPALGIGHTAGDCGLGWGEHWAQQAGGLAEQDCHAVGLKLRQGPSMRALAKTSSHRQGSASTAASLQHSAVGELPPMASSRTTTTLSCTGSEISIPPATLQEQECSWGPSISLL